MSLSDVLTEQWMDELRSGIKKKFLEELKKLPPESLDDVVRGGLKDELSELRCAAEK